jgi:hypothetical protein
VNDKLFIPQSVLDKWVETGKVVFNDSVLTLLKEKKSYTLTPAVRFMKLVAGEDTHSLMGRLRTTEKLAEIKAEHMMDSVIVGDTAYEVQEGFIAIVLADSEVSTEAEQEAPPAPPAPVVAPPPPAPKAAAAPPAPALQMTATPATEGDQDAELLTKFLLNNLNFS